MELGALTTTFPDPKDPHGPQKGRSDSLDYTFSEYFDAFDLPTGDGEDQMGEGSGLVDESDSDRSSIYVDTLEDL